jgi:hypothetical protein
MRQSMQTNGRGLAIETTESTENAEEQRDSQ